MYIYTYMYMHNICTSYQESAVESRWRDMERRGCLPSAGPAQYRARTMGTCQTKIKTQYMYVGLYLYIYLSINQSIYLSVYLYIYPCRARTVGTCHKKGVNPKKNCIRPRRATMSYIYICRYVYTYIYIHIYAYLSIYLSIYLYIHIYICIWTYIDIERYICLST